MVGSLILLLAITALAVFFCRRLPYLIVGWLWFVGMLVPVIGVVGIFVHSRADRYMYLSQIGLSIAVAWGVRDVCYWRPSHVVRWRQAAFAVVSGAAVLAFAGVSWRQTSYWHDTVAVWTRAASCDDHNTMAHRCLANIYAQQGKSDEAFSHIHKALATDSIARYLIADCHVLFGECLNTQGKINEGYRNSKKRCGATYDARVRSRLGIALARAGRPDQAITEFREAVRLAPTSSKAGSTWPMFCWPREMLAKRLASAARS